MPSRRKQLLVALSLTLLVGGTVNLQAQTPAPAPSVRLIEYTQEVEGSLDPESAAALYSFRGQQGDAVTISMKSWTFDSYLTLIDSGGNEVAWDDDSGGYPDALLGPYILPQTGDYQIRASTYTSETQGTFTLRLEKVELGKLSLGESAEVSLTERHPAAYFVYDGKVGDVLDIVVNSDEGLDTRLRVRGVGDSYDLVSDDDSGAGFDPEINHLLIPNDSLYIIAVEPYAPGMTGTVQLSLNASPLVSLDEGTQTISLGSKRTQDLLTFAGRAGEQVRITVRVTNGRPDYMSIHVTQSGQEITSISSSSVNELSFLMTPPADGRVNVQLENSSNVVLEVSLERAA